MNQEVMIDILSDKMKLIRVEYNYTQERMATILGISKKSLIQIEKRRIKANWTTVVALCALFRESEIIQNALEHDPLRVLDQIKMEKL